MKFDVEANRYLEKHIFSYDQKDPQGIIWNSIDINLSRDAFRMRRLLTYRSVSNNNTPLTIKDNVVKENCNFFDFKMNHLLHVEFSHFQLRRNVQSISSEELYVKTSYNKIVKYNPITRQENLVVSPEFLAVSFNVLGDYLIVGGMEGELMMADLHGNLKFSMVLTDESSRITNSCKLFMNQNGLNILACNNDKKIRIIDPNKRENLNLFDFEACVNHAAISKDFKKLGVCLDSTEDLIVDIETGKIIYELTGHTDFGFAVDWDPNNDYYIATGNQDRSVMLWDLRQGSKLTPVETLRSKMGAAYDVQYSPNGKYLVFVESGDFINIFDTREFKEKQSSDFFGEISGFCISEDERKNLTIFVGVTDSKYSSLIQMQEASHFNNIFI
jgi:WD40 repeat protein